MKLIVIYGSPAAGKYTLAKALSEKTGYKLFHNHLTLDLLKTIFEFGTPDFFTLSQRLRLEIIEEAARQNIPGLIFTFVYANDADDDAFIKELIKRVEKHNGEVRFLQLICDKNELLKRVTQESRKEFQKVASEEGLHRILDSRDMMSAIPFVESVQIDNTNLSVEETVEKATEMLNTSET